MEWRVIEGFPNYSVSKQGEVRNNTTSRILAYRKTGSGYFKVTLCRSGEKFDYYIHRIVAQTFIPNKFNKPEINHIDGNKRNNSVSNLEWATRKENITHLYNYLDSTEMRRKMGNSRKGERNGASHKVIRIEDGKIYSCISDAARDIGVNRMCVSDVCRGKQKTTGGYHYMYLNIIGEGLADGGHIGEE